MKWFFRIFFKTLRAILGPLLLLWDRLTTPKGVQRPAHEQQHVDQRTRHLVLYQYRTCPFCIKVRRAIKRLSLSIETRDAQGDPLSREQLLQGGGQVRVPCLKIVDENGDTTWMYESTEIV
ncbi:MAG: glutaredoxin, partial [Pseudomonadota bacterium]